MELNMDFQIGLGNYMEYNDFTTAEPDFSAVASWLSYDKTPFLSSKRSFILRLEKINV